LSIETRGSILPFLEVCYTFDLALGVIYHLNEEVCEGGSAEFGIFGAIEIAVVDSLSVGGVAETRTEGSDGLDGQGVWTWMGRRRTRHGETATVYGRSWWERLAKTEVKVVGGVPCPKFHDHRTTRHLINFTISHHHIHSKCRE
jgi:hypothetical protein